MTYALLWPLRVHGVVTFQSYFNKYSLPEDLKVTLVSLTDQVMVTYTFNPSSYNDTHL